jgi:hypothetical protein
MLWLAPEAHRGSSPTRSSAYPVSVLKVLALAMCLGGLAVACEEAEQAEPTLAYHYEVRGNGDNVKVTFLLPEAGLVDRIVRLPWVSQELRGRRGDAISLKVDGPSGSRVRCVVLYRRINVSYGGNGSGFMKQWANQPDEDQTVCALDGDSIG